MLNNIKKTKNIVISFAPHNDSVHIQAGGFVAWDGWVLIWRSTLDQDSVLKKMCTNFKLIPV